MALFGKAGVFGPLTKILHSSEGNYPFQHRCFIWRQGSTFANKSLEYLFPKWMIKRHSFEQWTTIGSTRKKRLKFLDGDSLYELSREIPFYQNLFFVVWKCQPNKLVGLIFSDLLSSIYNRDNSNWSYE